jgi:hypothetical protein
MDRKNDDRIRALIRGDWERFGSCTEEHEHSTFCEQPTKKELDTANINYRIWHRWKRLRRQNNGL